MNEGTYNEAPARKMDPIDEAISAMMLATRGYAEVMKAYIEACAESARLGRLLDERRVAYLSAREKLNEILPPA